jgi:hypothetical protein
MVAVGQERGGIASDTERLIELQRLPVCAAPKSV